MVGMEAKLYKWEIMMLTRLMLIVLLIGTFGCSSATYLRAKVTENPLDRVAQQAQEDWTVQRIDANTLELSDAWPIHSVLSLGYSASYANLAYNAADSELDVRYYFQSNQLGLLFIPFSLDAEPGLVGGALKPIMNGQIKDILQWSGASILSRRAGDRSETFPPKNGVSPGSSN